GPDYPTEAEIITSRAEIRKIYENGRGSVRMRAVWKKEDGAVVRNGKSTAGQRTVMPVALEKQADGWFCDMGKLEAVLAKPECKIMLLCSPQN
ncbi:aminotransferase class I/II-fold pyridoxal phosphate-dependent enzyme, partial [Escherichia coli]|uniref:aminotransferase class I/II-fold pyridoxal phosphate-dependent enzyme n=1 Tax=Escherichia coli TaxID=562 RepID=UPI00356B6E22